MLAQERKTPKPKLRCFFLSSEEMTHISITATKSKDNQYIKGCGARTDPQCCKRKIVTYDPRVKGSETLSFDERDIPPSKEILCKRTRSLLQR